MFIVIFIVIVPGVDGPLALICKNLNVTSQKIANPLNNPVLNTFEVRNRFCSCRDMLNFICKTSLLKGVFFRRFERW